MRTKSSSNLLLGSVFLLLALVGVLTTSLLISYDPTNRELGTAMLEKQGLTPPIVFIGDSLVEGVGASSAENTLPYRIFQETKTNDQRIWNFGTSGSTADALLKTQIPKLKTLDSVSRVYLLVGANDVTRQTPVAAFSQSIAGIFDGLSNTSVTVIGIPDLSATPSIAENQKASLKQRTIELNQVLKDESAKREDMKFIDTFEFTGDKILSESNLLSSDNYHPNDEGYRLLAEYITSR